MENLRGPQALGNKPEENPSVKPDTKPSNWMQSSNFSPSRLNRTEDEEEHFDEVPLEDRSPTLSRYGSTQFSSSSSDSEEEYEVSFQNQEHSGSASFTDPANSNIYPVRKETFSVEAPQKSPATSKKIESENTPLQLSARKDQSYSGPDQHVDADSEQQSSWWCCS